MKNKQFFLTLTEKPSFFPALLTLLWLLAVLIVNPIGEFPINDDWAYTKNVFELSVHKKYYVDDWPAMTLISQTIYGTVVSFIFGFSFTSLRISMLVLAFISTLVLYYLIKRKTKNDFVSFFLTAGFSFGQIHCALSFTFMTDIFFLSFLIFSVYSLVCYLDNLKLRNYLFYIFFCTVAILNRQHGLLLPLLIVFPLLWKTQLTLKKIVHALFPFAVCFSFHLAYRYILKVYSPQSNVHGIGDFFAAMSSLNISEKYFRSGDILMISGWILLPCSFLLFFSPATVAPGKRNIFIVLTLLVVSVLTFSAIKYFPFGNIWTSGGIGPKALKDFFTQQPSPFIMPDYIKFIIRGLAFGSACIIVYNTISIKKQFFKNENFTKGFSVAVCFFLFSYFVFIVLNESYLDRYVLPLAFFLLIFNVPVTGQLKKQTILALGVLVMILFFTTTLQVKDFMNWNRTRWQAIASLNKKGINEHFIDGGFEYNAWYKPGKGYESTPENKSWYWVDKDDFLISGRKQNGYSVKEFYCYRHYLPYAIDTLFVLEKNDSLKKQ